MRNSLRIIIWRTDQPRDSFSRVRMSVIFFLFLFLILLVLHLRPLLLVIFFSFVFMVFLLLLFIVFFSFLFILCTPNFFLFSPILSPFTFCATSPAYMTQLREWVQIVTIESRDKFWLWIIIDEHYHIWGTPEITLISSIIFSPLSSHVGKFVLSS